MNTDDLRDQLATLHHDQPPASAMHARLAVQRKASQQNQRRFVAVAATAAIVLSAVGLTASRGRESAQGFSGEPKVETDDGSVPRLVPTELPPGMTLQLGYDYTPSGVTTGSFLPFAYGKDVDGRVTLYANPGDDLANVRSIAVVTLAGEPGVPVTDGEVRDFGNGLRVADRNTVNDRSTVAIVGRGMSDIELLQIAESAVVSADGLDVLSVTVPDAMVVVARSRVGSPGLPFRGGPSFFRSANGNMLAYGTTPSEPGSKCCEALLSLHSFRETPELETLLRWEYGLRRTEDLEGAPAYEGSIDLGLYGALLFGRWLSASGGSASAGTADDSPAVEGPSAPAAPSAATGAPAAGGDRGDLVGGSMLLWRSRPGVVSVLHYAGRPDAGVDLRRVAGSLRAQGAEEFGRYLASTTTTTFTPTAQPLCLEGSFSACSTSSAGSTGPLSPTTISAVDPAG